MILDNIKGENENTFKKLSNIAASGRVTHAYIIEGDMSTEKDTAARCFAKAVLCREHPGKGCDGCIICNKIEHGNHEDVFTVEKTDNSIKDSDIAKLQERLRTKPLGERNIAIIKDADTMTKWAQNRLLKTLEEPPEGTVIMLLSENIENLLPTIRSRCTVIRLTHYYGKKSGNMDNTALLAAEALISKRPFYTIKKILEGVWSTRDSALEFLDALENLYGGLAKSDKDESRIYSTEYISRAVLLIEEARRDISRNINTGYVIKNLMIKIGG